MSASFSTRNIEKVEIIPTNDRLRSLTYASGMPLAPVLLNHEA
jgi:hypothetical protein